MNTLDSTFAALGDETRRAILTRLMQGETRLSDLAEPFDMSQTAVSKHVRVLADAGLVTIEKRGRSRYCCLVARPMKQAADWLNEYQAFWTQQFDNLGQYLAHEGLIMEFMKSQPGTDPIVVEGWFAAPPSRVFAAWTDPDIVMKWFGRAPNSMQSASIDLRVGGAWRFVFVEDGEKSEGLEGEYQEIRPDEKLVFSWTHVVTHANGEREKTPYSRVEVNFSAHGKGTFVRLVHSAVRTEDARLDIGGGWTASFGSLTGILGGADTA